MRFFPTSMPGQAAVRGGRLLCVAATSAALLVPTAGAAQATSKPPSSHVVIGESHYPSRQASIVGMWIGKVVRDTGEVEQPVTLTAEPDGTFITDGAVGQATGKWTRLGKSTYRYQTMAQLSFGRLDVVAWVVVHGEKLSGTGVGTVTGPDGSLLGSSVSTITARRSS